MLIKKTIIFLLVTIITLAVAVLAYFKLPPELIRHANRTYPLNFRHTYILDKNIDGIVYGGDDSICDSGAFYVIRPINSTRPNSATGGGMIIGSGNYHFDLERFYGQKVRIRGRRYFGMPLLIDGRTDNCAGGIVIEIREIELAD
ncbi:MAG: hypothetical protein LBG64_02985 [Pseudomonadales bacterium]|jgi:hypothetical protein|nr:hypothetical protein [Pseudomonadales bacterium]